METSSTSFQPCNIDEIDLKLDSISIPSYPIKRNQTLATDFYLKFLRECNFYENPNVANVINYTNFIQTNFLLVENLKRKKILTGSLTLHLKFKDLLQKKLYLLLMPLTPKKLRFDEFSQPYVVDFSGKSENGIY